MPTHIEKAASKVMGTAKQAKGTLEGLKGVFKTLMKEHGEATALLWRVKGSDDPETKARLWPTIRRELLAHEQGELAIVYPVYAEYPETRKLAVRHNQEAERLASMIGRIDKLNPRDEAFTELFEQLAMMVNEHVEEEEGEIFPAGQKTFGEQAEELDKAYLSKKQAIMGKD
ncbi:MAG: hemerythrin domain-containing protein [Myxococcales bacterium]